MLKGFALAPFLMPRPISCLRLPGIMPEMSSRLNLRAVKIGKGFRCSMAYSMTEAQRNRSAVNELAMSITRRPSDRANVGRAKMLLPLRDAWAQDQ
jgi:hypothetical protein